MGMDMKDGGSRTPTPTGAMRERSSLVKGRYDLISPIALHRLAIVMAKGALKYSDRNWEKGMPLSWFIDSALRHLNQYLEGQRDEDHLGQAMFNVMAAIHGEELILRGQWDAKFDDLPRNFDTPPSNGMPIGAIGAPAKFSGLQLLTEGADAEVGDG